MSVGSCVVLSLQLCRKYESSKFSGSMDGLIEETDIGCEWPDGEVEAKSRCFHQVGYMWGNGSSIGTGPHGVSMCSSTTNSDSVYSVHTYVGT